MIVFYIEYKQKPAEQNNRQQVPSEWQRQQ